MILISLICFSFGTEIPVKAKEVAKDSYMHWVSMAFENGKTRYGFQTSDQISDVKLGTPFKIWEIAYTDILDYNSVDPIHSLVKTSTDQEMDLSYELNTKWYYPILVKNEVRVFITIDKNGDKWIVDELGFHGLAKNIENVKKVYKDVTFYKFGPKPYFYFQVGAADSDNLTKIMLVEDLKSDTISYDLKSVDFSISELLLLYKDVQ